MTIDADGPRALHTRAYSEEPIVRERYMCCLRMARARSDNMRWSDPDCDHSICSHSAHYGKRECGRRGKACSRARTRERRQQLRVSSWLLPDGQGRGSHTRLGPQQCGQFTETSREASMFSLTLDHVASVSAGESESVAENEIRNYGIADLGARRGKRQAGRNLTHDRGGAGLAGRSARSVPISLSPTSAPPRQTSKRAGPRH